MGCALSSAEKEAVQRSLAIDKSLATEGVCRQNEIKLLLLGEYVGGGELGRVAGSRGGVS